MIRRRGKTTNKGWFGRRARKAKQQGGRPRDLRCEPLEDRCMLSITLNQIGTYETGIFDDSAAEIVAYDPVTQRVFVSNNADQAVDVLDISDPTNPRLDFSIDVSSFGDAPTSVAVHGNLVAVAIKADPITDPGVVAFFDTDGIFINDVEVGALPDMVVFTPNGRQVLVANEGEPSDDYLTDPEGSVSIIDVTRGAHRARVTTADFNAFDSQIAQLRDDGVRIFGPGASVSQDLEPEFITVSHDSQTAWVTLQENNAIAILDISTASVTSIVPLGFKDHSATGNGLDASNKDGEINIANWPVHGMYQPDSIASYQVRGQTYLVMANEGDARDYDGFSEETRVKKLDLDPTVFPGAETLQENENLGRLKTTTALGDTDGDGDFDEIFSYGARSFSIRTADGALVFDSGDDIAQITASALPDDFNSTNDENDSFDNRSDDKGAEPEGVVLGSIRGEIYAFIGLERVGGIMVYNVSDPTAPVFQQYITNRDFAGDAEAGTAGDLGPEGMAFISEADSPTRQPLLVVANEVSGTTTIFAISVSTPAPKGQFAVVAPRDEPIIGSSDSEPQRPSRRGARDEVFSRFDRAERRQRVVRRAASHPFRRLQAAGIDRALTEDVAGSRWIARRNRR
ncbi:MAG: choice-of-anchor I family protein [Planctomycetes bacterium]|nr:choice-of-anchor I family protein [Planctomycetota bacterium]